MIKKVCPLQVQQAVQNVLKRWGMPYRMRFDNGYPFVHTRDRNVPTPLAIWLVSMGIQVIINDPSSPQQNGSVECTQRISSRWANPKACASPELLQQALDQVSYEHIYILRQRDKHDLTRQQQYPTLTANPNKYHSDLIQPQRVKEYLRGFRWERSIPPMGIVSMFGYKWYIGTRHTSKSATILYDDLLNEWLVSLDQGKIIKRFPGPDLSIEAIRNLTVFVPKLTT